MKESWLVGILAAGLFAVTALSPVGARLPDDAPGFSPGYPALGTAPADDICETAESPPPGAWLPCHDVELLVMQPVVGLDDQLGPQ